VTAETDVAAEAENGKDDPSVAVDEPAGVADEPAVVAEDAEEPAGLALPDSPPEAIEEAEVLPARSDVWPLAQGGAEIAPERALEDSDQPEFQARVVPFLDVGVCARSSPWPDRWRVGRRVGF